MREIAKALQLYYDNNNAYPSTGGQWYCLGHGTAGQCWAGGYSGSDALDASLAPYISKVPDDPLNRTSGYGDAYMYNSSYPTSAGTGAVVHWGIEKSNPTSADCAGGYLDNWGAGNGIGGNYYCILLIR